MFGLDEKIASLSDGSSLWIVLLVGVLLGLRHATDPDHLAAVTSLVAGGKERAAGAARRLGLAWGLGHAVTLFAFGLPIVVLNRHVPDWAQRTAETVIALVIVFLAVRLLRRWRLGHFHVHPHDHGDVTHAHLHAHGEDRAHAHPHAGRGRLGAFGIGLVHGMGGSAGVGVLVLASVDSTALAVASLVLLAVFTAASMAILSTGFGRTLVSTPVRAAFNGVAPALGIVALAFGVWYGLGALELAPYIF